MPLTRVHTRDLPEVDASKIDRIEHGQTDVVSMLHYANSSTHPRPHYVRHCARQRDAAATLTDNERAESS